MLPIVHQLMELGLTEKEALVYVAMLEIGSASVQEIADKSGVVRTTIYDIVKDLQQRGLVASHEQGSKQLYFAESPISLQQLLERQRAALDERQIKVHDAMSSLLAMYKSPTQKPHVRYFEGDAGVVAIREIMSDSRGEYLSFAAIDEDLIERGSNVNEQQRHRMSRRMRGKYLFALKPGCVRPATDLSSWQVRNISYEKTPFKGEINIVDHKVAAYVFGQDRSVGFVVESEDLANLFRAFFAYAWNAATPVATR